MLCTLNRCAIALIPSGEYVVCSMLYARKRKSENKTNKKKTKIKLVTVIELPTATSTK